MNPIKTSSAIVLLAASLAVHADESLPNDEMEKVQGDQLKALVSECESCHGKNGVSQNKAIPSLAGKSADYILKSVEQFYFYERHCPNADIKGPGPKSGARNMCDVADRLTKQEVEALGAYFEAQKPAAD
jgi:cytochrome c553